MFICKGRVLCTKVVSSASINKHEGNSKHVAPLCPEGEQIQFSGVKRGYNQCVCVLDAYLFVSPAQICSFVLFFVHSKAARQFL